MNKSILIVTPSRLTPANSGGHYRTLNVALGLSRAGYHTKVLALAGRADNYKDRGAKQADFDIMQIEGGLEEVVDLSLSQGVAQTIFRRLGYSKLWAYIAWPLIIASRKTKSLVDAADIVIFDSPFVHKKAFFKGKSTYVLSHNVEADISRDAKFLERIFWLPLVKRVERSQPARMAGIITCAPSDTEFYRNLHHSVCEVANGMQRLSSTLEDDNHARTSLGIDEDICLLFVGSNYGPNKKAAEFLREFVRSHYQKLIESRVRFVIAGSVYDEPYEDEVLTITGRVESMTPYLQAADIAINAVTTGSGSNVKNFEALAAGLPIISTEFGLRGLDPSLVERLWLYENDHELLDIILRVADGRRYLKDLGDQILEDHKDHILMDSMIENKLIPFLELTHISDGGEKS
ncbi:MAG: glycosyltransferase [Pseudobacteriovorax sp.]|nr:glycosyltransferase [Pseudobacteriovorax sp.]